jgi:hypothetical protein
MNYSYERQVWVAFAALSLVVGCHDLKAQTTAATAATSAATGSGMGLGTGLGTGTATGIGTGMGMGMGMGGMGMGGMGLMPMLYATNPTASLSPTDAAALGMSTQNNRGMGMSGLFLNPIAAQSLFGSGSASSGNQIAAMMLANQMGATTGIGSGQLSGVRPGAGQLKGLAKQAATKPRGTMATPGGLAGRYFNRTTSVTRPVNASRIPQSYYTRQSRYYPQVVR